MTVNSEQVRVSPVKRLSQLRKDYIFDAVNFGLLIGLGFHTPVVMLLLPWSLWKGADEARQADKIRQEIFADNEQRFKASLSRD